MKRQNENERVLFVPKRDTWGRWHVARVENRKKEAEKEKKDSKSSENNFRHSHFVSDVGFQFLED